MVARDGMCGVVVSLFFSSFGMIGYNHLVAICCQCYIQPQASLPVFIFCLINVLVSCICGVEMLNDVQ